MTREKSSPDRRRCIVDLSWPQGNSVNSNVHANSYLGKEVLLTLPTTDHIVQEILKIPDCYIAKVDISRAFRHIPIDPRDIKYLGIFWKAYFYDLVLPFGFKFGSHLFERLSDSIRFIMAQKGYLICNYIDDMLILDNKHHCKAAYTELLALLPKLGLEISNSKLVPPTKVTNCLRVQIDCNEFNISVPPDKLTEIITL